MNSTRDVVRAMALFAVCWVLLAHTPATAGDPLPEASGFREAVSDGAGGVDLRYRLEHVQDQGYDKNALASTLRTALFY